jgi:hypothetical protein
VVDADTGQAQPESVAMTEIRVCNVGSVNGVEAPSPSFPPVSATNLLVAYVLLNPSGVVSIQQVTATQLANLTSVEAQIQALLAWQSIVNGQIATLQSSLAALAAMLANFVTWDKFQKLVDLVNQIWQLINRPASYVMDNTDNFLDTTYSAVGTNVDGLYSGFVHEGLRFQASSAGWTGKLALLNLTEPLIQAWDTFVLPKPSGMRVRMDCSFPTLDWVAERVLSHPYWVFSPRKLNWARTRHRCGIQYLPGPLTTVLKVTGTTDPIYINLRFDVGDTWVAVVNTTVVNYPDDNWDWPRYVSVREKYFWFDDVDVYYWSKVIVNLSYSANHFGQSFLNAQDGWLGGLTVFSMVPNYFQPLTLLIFRCDQQGVPDHQQCIARLDLDASSIQACYSAPILVGDIVSSQTILQQSPTWTNTYVQGVYQAVITGTHTEFETVYTNIPVYAYPVRLTFTPVFLEAGKRYSFHLISTYDHQFACSVDYTCYSVHQGDCWDYDGSRWFRVAASPKTLRFMLHYLVWGQWGSPMLPSGVRGDAPTGTSGGQLRFPIALAPLQLAGGITAIDVLAEHIIPPATDLSYAVQVAGAWMPFACDPDNPTLASNPAVLPFEVIFTGTTDVMPGVSLTNSQVKLTGPTSNSYHHISTVIARGGATTVGMKVIALVHSWNASHHTLVCTLHYGATHKTADVTAAPVLQPDGVTYLFSWTFNVVGQSSYQVELDGTTDGTGDNFVVTQRIAFGA